MDERDLDRAIDLAAGDIIAREPTRGLSSNVMARVRQGRSVAPRLVWAAAASIALCAVIGFSSLNRVPTTVATLPRAMQLPVARPAHIPDPPVVVTRDVTTASPRAVVSRPRIVAPIDMTARDVSPIEPIETQPIVMSAIDVPQLEREATLIDTLDIAPLTIAPLATSND